MRSRNNHPTASGGVSGPFVARRGFDARGHLGTNFGDAELPARPENPDGIGEVVNTKYFFDHANFIRWDGRMGHLPNPMTDVILTGETYAVRMDFGGRDLGRIVIWDGNLTTGPAKPELPPGNVIGTNQVGEALDPASWVTESDGLITGAESGALTHAVGDYVRNSTGANQTANSGGAAGVPVNAGQCLLWMGDTRLGQNGWAAVDGTTLTFTHNLIPAVGVTPGDWRFMNVQSWLKALKADPDQPTDQQSGDFQTTLEASGKELKVFANGAWQKIYSESDVKAWIASLSLFEGTVNQEGGTAVGAIQFHELPDLATLSRDVELGQVSHYWTFVGAPNTPVHGEYALAGLTNGVPGVYKVTVAGGTEVTVRVTSATTGFVGIDTLGVGVANGDTLNLAAGDLGAGSSASSFDIPDTTKPATPIIGSDLNGALLNPGDWIQISNRGTIAAPDLHYVTIGGDLLAKARADRLFGLAPWVQGSWEAGSLVVFNQSIYRAASPVTGTDPQPGTGAPVAQVDTLTITAPAGGGEVYTVEVNGTPATYTSVPGDTDETVRNALITALQAIGAITPTPGGAQNLIALTAATPGTAFTVQVITPNIASATTTANVPGIPSPWQKVDLSGGVRWVMLDGNLPTKAPAGEIYFVLQSAQAAGAGALYYWDDAAGRWMPLGGSGGGAPLDLTGGLPVVNIGTPIGAIMMWIRPTPPPGWLICDGSTFSAGTYPELAVVLANTTLPDLRGLFVRGAGLNGNGAGDAARQVWTTQDDATGKPKTAAQQIHNANTSASWAGGGGVLSSYKGDPWYAGWDDETRPKNMAVNYIIKAADVAQRLRRN